ncbi:MAG: hypothetical protein B6I25_00855 [Planctomycetales bacterium 4572_13]|nr:MAG: hypothetical protein B6I25_00855 [Planctomycetales bacterium 4572_13]
MPLFVSHMMTAFLVLVVAICSLCASAAHKLSYQSLNEPISQFRVDFFAILGIIVRLFQTALLEMFTMYRSCRGLKTEKILYRGWTPRLLYSELSVLIEKKSAEIREIRS